MRTDYPYMPGWRNNYEGNKPEIKHSVLIYTTHGIVEGEWLGDKWFQYRWNADIKDSDVLYWMHLCDLERLEKEDEDESLEKEQDVNLEKEMNRLVSLEYNNSPDDEWEMVIARHFYVLGLNSKANVPKIRGWVARLKNGELELGSNKQRYYVFCGEMHIADEGPVMLIDKSLFPELHWLDEPIEVELIINRI